jgi:hypothetical protein
MSTAYLGDWVQGSEKFLIPELKKATTGGSALPRGKIAGLNEGTGVWAVASLGFVGKTALVTHTNLDSDPVFTGLVGGGTGYAKFNGPVKAHAPVVCSSTSLHTGELVQQSIASVSTTPTQEDVEAVRDQLRAVVGFYRGHADEGDGGTGRLITDAADGDIGKVEMVRSQ